MLAEVDKSGAAIRDMFAGVAPRYDLLNHLLSASLDLVWRRRAAAALGATGDLPVLDLCAGTGDQALALGGRGLRVVAADFCLPMLAIARHKFGRRGEGRPWGLAADALALPFAARSFGGVTVAFGLRNVADLDQALREIARALRPAGKLIVLEFALPTQRVTRRLYLLYFRRILPLIGKLLSPRAQAYTYLPSSVPGFAQRETFLAHLAAAGFEELSWSDLSGGIVCLYAGRRAA